MFSDVEMMVFMEELEEKIQSINDNVLMLEKDGGTPEVIQEIFRAAHTIKGSSGVMGFEKMAGLTHEIENLFDRLRQGTMEINTYLVDVLFEALDKLKMLKDEITGEAREVQVEDVLLKLRSLQKSGGGGDAAGKEIKTVPAFCPTEGVQGNLDSAVMDMVREAEVRGYQAFWLNVAIDSGCQMKNVRAFLVFETLQQIGDIIRSDPPAEDIQDGRYGQGFSLVLISKEDMGQVKNLVMSIAEVSSVEITQLDSGDVNDYSESAEDEAGREEAMSDTSQRAAVPGVEKTTIKTVRVDVQKLDNL
ncbi:MAG: Hpt domain-containing protein, partial [Desulfocucumaceae bacterium]